MFINPLYFFPLRNRKYKITTNCKIHQNINPSKVMLSHLFYKAVNLRKKHNYSKLEFILN